MSKKPSPKPRTGTKKATEGIRIANTIYKEGTMTDALQAAALAQQIDRAIRRAVREAYEAGETKGYENIERKYGVKL